ncbi:MAG: protein adenylyltransferase SelO family protein, partial [Flammeovirgaceae bacterium]
MDYGPCAFMDQFSMDRVFSSIDINGRYAYGNQPHIAQWNLMRFAEAILPLLHDEMEIAVKLAEEAIAGYNALFNEAWLLGMRKKLGLFGEESGDILLIQDLLQWMQDVNADYTLTFRDLIQENIMKIEKYQSSDFG